MYWTLVGLFDDLGQSRSAAQELLEAGLALQGPRPLEIVEPGTVRGLRPAGRRAVILSATAGAGVGTVLGGTTGLLASLDLLIALELMPALATGLLTMLAGAIIGAGAGSAVTGLIRGLQRRGVHEEKVSVCGEGTRRALALITVQATNATVDQALEIMGRHGVIAVQRRMHG